MRRASEVVILLLLAPCVPAAAEESTSRLRTGDRIRLTRSCDLGDPPSGTSCYAVGRLVAAADGTITLASGESTTTHSLDAASRIEVSGGVRSRWKAGAAVGLVVGAAGTYVLLSRGGSTSPCDESANQDAIGAAGCAGLTALGGVAGAGLGALVGRFVKIERWRDVRLEALRLTVGPTRRSRLQVMVALSF
jgi:hypothetical protein